MSRAGFLAWACLLLPLSVTAAPLTHYLPEEVRYAEDVPQPAATLGHEVGDWHVRHDALLAYLRTLAAHSDRISMEVQGKTHEGRPLALLTITSPRNHARLEQIREAHLAVSRGELPAEDSLPVVIWLGYSIHGDEASGSNAAPLTAYHLAAARGEAIDRLLENAIILIDPSLNPDGMGRFASWANSHRGTRPVTDPNTREHRQAWPGGRTNHYWFDLNRDWLLVQHPESRARVATYRRWQPHLSGDYHEMGSGSTYFFQPGVPTRTHPLTPERNQELTRSIAEFHAATLDADGTPYYTEETFDDFYYGKGSTYPDINGSVGVLFEQSSVRGHAMRKASGVVHFADAIRNQFRTSLSMLDAGLELRKELIDYRYKFHRDVASLAKADNVRGWLLAFPGDPARRHHMLELLQTHDIRSHELARETTIDGVRFRVGEAWVVPVDQPQYLLARALFEVRKDFADSTFYDVSAWTLQMAMGAQFVELDRKSRPETLLGDVIERSTLPNGTLHTGSDDVAWVVPWNGYYAPRALVRLLEADVAVVVASRTMTVDTPDGVRAFDRGSLLVRRGEQSISTDDLQELLSTIATEDGLDVFGVRSGLTPAGVDLGSPTLFPVRLPRPLLVTGRGVSANDAGEIWHLLDFRFGIELPMIDGRDLSDAGLREYSHVIIADGSPEGWGDEPHAALRRFVSDGGTVIAGNNAAGWISKQLFKADEAIETEEAEDKTSDVPRPARVSYSDYDRRRAIEQIGGSIFEIDVDTTHPLGFGYDDSRVAVFKSGARQPFAASDNPYENVAFYSANPLLSGYASEKNQERFAESIAIRVEHRGRGRTILFADNVTFRGYWFGANRLFLNALFFGESIRKTRWNEAER